MAASHIVFVGHHKNRLVQTIKALRAFPFERIVLVLGEQNSSGEQIARRVAESIRSELESFFDISIEQVDKKDVMRAALEIASIVAEERARGYSVIINVSGALRTFAIAGYIAGSLTSSRIVTSIPRYDADEQEIGIEEIVELPALPIYQLRREQREILAAVNGAGGTYLEDIVSRLKPSLKKGSIEYSNERSRIIHQLKTLESLGLVERGREGRHSCVRLTMLGRIMRVAT